MNINKKHFKQAFLSGTKFMALISLNKKILLIALTAFLSNEVLAFSIGAANGLNCGTTFTPSCDGRITSILSNNQYEEVHQKITHDALIKQDVGFTLTGSSKLVGFGFSQILDIAEGNRLVDYNQPKHALHFDNEKFKDAQNQLQELEIDILNSLKQSRVINSTEAANLREKLGIYFHTLQDFFAHSTWVNSHSGAKDVPKFWKSSINLTATFINPCPYTKPNGNMLEPPLPDTGTIFDNNTFTSGYAGSFGDLFNARAPASKCAHGLLNNGIHQDWTGRELHGLAREQAIHATAEAAKYILNVAGNNPDNVCMFMTDKPCSKKVGSVSVLKTGTGKGKVTSTPAGINCGDGTQNICQFSFENAPSITLVAEASSGSVFKGWSRAGSGACSGSTNSTCTINLLDILSTSSIDISAIFDTEQSSNPSVEGTWRGLIYQGNAVPVCFQNTTPAAPATLVIGCLNSFQAIFSTKPQNETGATVLMTSNNTTTASFDNGTQTTETFDTTIISQDATWTYDPLSKTVTIFVGGNGNLLPLASGSLSVDNQNKQILTFTGSLTATFTR
jgi:hypothetical protein